MSSVNSGRSKKIVGLFLAAALNLTPGCSLSPLERERSETLCLDVNHDGYCDEDGRPVSGEVNRTRRTGFFPFFRSYGSGAGSRTSVSTPAASGSRGVSSGSKAGIGSSSRSGGGSSGG